MISMYEDLIINELYIAGGTDYPAMIISQIVYLIINVVSYINILIFNRSIKHSNPYI